MTNEENKKQKWEILKQELLSMIPKKFKIKAEDLDNDGKYFHPVIEVEDNIIIRGQADIDNNDRIYAWSIQTHQTIGCCIRTVSFDINDQNQINKILVNWDKYKIKIKKYLEISKIINENINMLQEIKNNIQCNLLNNTFTDEDRKECLNKLFSVKEWIENERIIENYSGII